MAKDRAAILKEYRDQILEGMARTLWILAYADYAEDLPDDLRAAYGVHRARAGQDWDDIAPETPKAATKAATDLAKLYEQGQGGKRGEGDLVELYVLAQTVDLEEDFELGSENAQPITKADTKSRAEMFDQKWKLEDAFTFGGMLAHMALGNGVSWFDDHKAFELTTPFFECHYDGDELTWSGGISDVREVSGKLGEIIVVNHDDASWTKHSYVLGFGGFSFAGQRLLLIYANGLEDALDEMIDWVAENEPASLQNDTVTEAYNEAIAGGMDEDAAREDAEVDMTSGGNAGDYIASEDWRIIAEDPDEDELQRIAKRKNPTCTAAYHEGLKHDVDAWRALELKGRQQRRSGGVLEMRNCGRCHSTLAIPVTGNPGRPVCSIAAHTAMKRDPKVWQTLELKGYEHYDADEDGAAETVEIRNCHCGGTLYKPLTAAEAAKVKHGNPAGREAGPDDWVLIGPDLDGDGGSHRVHMGDEVRIVASGETGRLVRRRVGSRSDDYVVVDVDGERVRVRSHEIVPAQNTNPTEPRRAAAKKAAKRARAVLDARAAAGFEGGCDDPQCRGWDVFDTGRGIGVQACDMCNEEARLTGHPELLLSDQDAKHLPEAARAQRRVREGR